MAPCMVEVSSPPDVPVYPRSPRNVTSTRPQVCSDARETRGRGLSCSRETATQQSRTTAVTNTT